MIPKRIRSKYQPISARESADACFTTGMLVCCGVSDFSLRAGGDVRKSVFGKMYLLSENEGVVLDAQCSRCGQMFSVFDSALDGYDACTNAPVNPAPAAKKEIRCVKCQGKHFAVRLAYEYPGRQELETLDGSPLPAAHAAENTKTFSALKRPDRGECSREGIPNIKI